MLPEGTYFVEIYWNNEVLQYLLVPFSTVSNIASCTLFGREDEAIEAMEEYIKKFPEDRRFVSIGRIG